MRSVERGALHTWKGIMLLSRAHAARVFHPRSTKARVYKDRIGQPEPQGGDPFLIPLPIHITISELA
jgi:hypothetical protein